MFTYMSLCKRDTKMQCLLTCISAKEITKTHSLLTCISLSKACIFAKEITKTQCLLTCISAKEVREMQNAMFSDMYLCQRDTSS